MKQIILLFVATIVMVGCDVKQSELELRASQLQTGMTKEDAKQLFSNFPIGDDTNIIGEITFPTKTTTLYSTNRTYASIISFLPNDSKFLPYERCAIYFDSNNIIVAHYLIRMD